MSLFVKRFWNDENGFIISAELVIILTVAVLAMIVGLSYVQSAVVSEMSDVGNAISSLNQNYAYTGFYSMGYWGKVKSFYAGSAYDPAYDPRGAVLGYDGYNYMERGCYSQDFRPEPEIIEEPCEICKPGEVVDCPHCEAPQGAINQLPPLPDRNEMKK